MYYIFKNGFILLVLHVVLIKLFADAKVQGCGHMSVSKHKGLMFETQKKDTHSSATSLSSATGLKSSSVLSSSLLPSSPWSLSSASRFTRAK
jgi:hypothetical protein